MLDVVPATVRDGGCPRVAVAAHLDEAASLERASGDAMREPVVVNTRRPIIGDPPQHRELNFVE
ncbi:hypothetical protein JM654_15375 [Microbacterium oxydans]|nr:hypothetical protein [Microbacterium oxydans]